MILGSVRSNQPLSVVVSSSPALESGSTPTEVYQPETCPVSDATAGQTLDDILIGSSSPIPAGKFVFFGATGDLVSKRLVRDALAELAEDNELDPARHEVIMTARKPVDGSTYMTEFQDGDEDSNPISEAGFANLRKLTGLEAEGSQLDIVRLGNEADFSQLSQRLGPEPAVLYGAIPPRYFGDLLESVAQSGLMDQPDTKVILDKPFGNDAAHAQELSKKIDDLGRESCWSTTSWPIQAPAI